MAIGLTEDSEGLRLLRIVLVVVSRLLAEFERPECITCNCLESETEALWGVYYILGLMGYELRVKDLSSETKPEL